MVVEQMCYCGQNRPQEFPMEHGVIDAMATVSCESTAGLITHGLLDNGSTEMACGPGDFPYEALRPAPQRAIHCALRKQFWWRACGSHAGCDGCCESDHARQQTYEKKDVSGIRAKVETLTRKRGRDYRNGQPVAKWLGYDGHLEE